MRCSVAEAQERVDSAEFAEWLAEYSLEPWGEQREDWRSAMIAQTMANAWCATKGQSFKIETFMPKFKSRSRKRQTVNQMAAAAKAFCDQAAMMGERKRQR